MAPTVTNNEQTQGKSISDSTDLKQNYKFIYKNTEYDCTGYAKKHPGGQEFFEKQLHEREDLTEYFQALHSKTAHKMLEAMPKTGRTVTQSADSIIYEEMNEKVKHLYKNTYWKDFAFFIFVVANFLIGSFASNPIIAFICIFNAQVVSGWLCHSWAHGRDQMLYNFVNWFSPIFAGVSTRWWNRKHNLHHMFTNVHGKDEDILGDYPKVVFGFLYLKWNVDSFMFDYNHIRVLGLLLHFIFYLQQNIFVFLIAQYAAGFVSAVVLVGNHEKEQAFESGKHGMNFVKHQIVTARDYDYHGLFWLTYMGGMQYQSEHHLFPQIPFYNLPELRRILLIELPKHKYSVKVDSVF